MRDSFKKFLINLRKLKADLKEKDTSFHILEDIMFTLLPLNEDKLRMINQVIKIISAANNISSSDLSSLISSELFDDDQSKFNAENFNSFDTKNKLSMLSSKAKLEKAGLVEHSKNDRDENVKKGM